MKTNIPMKRWELLNLSRRADKKSVSSIAEITTYLSILTLNVNGLKFPIKRHLLANWIKKEDTTISCLHENYLTDRDKHCLRVKRWKNIYQSNGP
jgi:hypothetical protein